MTALTPTPSSLDLLASWTQAMVLVKCVCPHCGPFPRPWVLLVMSAASPQPPRAARTASCILPTRRGPAPSCHLHKVHQDLSLRPDYPCFHIPKRLLENGNTPIFLIKHTTMKHLKIGNMTVSRSEQSPESLPVTARVCVLADFSRAHRDTCRLACLAFLGRIVGHC